MRTGKENRDQWIVKCPKCGKIRNSCKHVTPDDLKRVVRLLKAGVEVYESEEEAEPEDRAHVHEADRSQIFHLTTPRFALDDVVLSARTREAIQDALIELRHKRLIFNRWGMRRVVRKNKGLSLLFAGPPGTGKTMTAEAIAKELKRPLLVVNYAHLENMWVGETEKNIEAVFKQADMRNAVLFFDEADAVFHRRGFSSAPWTNRDVNVLLHHIENSEGLVILATNLARVMDKALDRRIDIAVEFEMPSADLRKEIFRRTIPPRAPVGKDVDLDELARKYELSGGSILNVVRQSMRTSLRRGKRHRITMDDFRRAAEHELRKAEVIRKDHMGEWKVEQRRQRLGGYA